MKYKAVISDFDNTIVDLSHILSKETEDAIRMVINSGLYFSIATGRSFMWLRPICKQLNLTTPQAVRGGAEIIDPKTEKVLYAQYMEDEAVNKFIDLLKKEDISFFVEQKEDYFGHVTKFFPQRIRTRKFRPLEELVVNKIPKFVVFTTDENTQKVDGCMNKAMDDFPTLHIIKSYIPPNMVWDVTSEKATKHLATLELTKLLHVAPEETIGIGDGYNDFPLLTACGYRIAMGTAPDELKEIADFVAPSHGQNGFAVAMRHIVENVLPKN